MLSPAPQREAIAAALFKVFEPINGTGPGQFAFNYFSRQFRMFDNITPASQPAFCMIYLGETQHQAQAFGLREYVLHFLAQFVFQTNPGDSLAGEQIAYSILQSLDTYFPAFPAGPNTLGGAPGVVNAWIDGEVELDTGIIEQPMVLKIPIKVLCGQ